MTAQPAAATREREMGQGRVDGAWASLDIPQATSASCTRPLTHSLRFPILVWLLGSRRQIGPILPIDLLELVHHVSIHLWQVLHLQVYHPCGWGKTSNGPQVLAR